MPGVNRARLLLRFAAVLTALLALSCEQVIVTTVEVDRIDVAPASSSVRVTQTTRLTVTVLSRDGRALSGRPITWTSAEPAIAEVDESGMVRGLTPGTATIRASSEGVVGSATVTVTAGPTIAAAPPEVEFTAVQNGATPGDRTVNVTNAGDGALNGLTASVAYPAGQPTGWLTATLGSTAPTQLVLSARQAGLAPGTYTATVAVASADASNSPVPVTVRLDVIAPQPAIALGATTASFAAPEGGADPAQQSVAITNAGGGTLSGLTASIGYSSGQPTGWLTAALATGTAPTTLALRATTGSLPQGVYTAAVQVAAPVAQNTPQTVSVTFTVGAAQPSIGVNPSTLSFDAVKGGANPASSTVQLTNTGGGTLDGLAVSVTYPGGQPAGWVTTGLSGTSAPATLAVGAVTGALDAGTFTATVRVTAPGAVNSPQSIDVTFQVQPPPPTIAVSSGNVEFSATLLSGDPAPQQLAITNAGGGTLTGLTRSIAYASGEPPGWLMADLSTTNAPATLTLTARIGSLAVGTYSAKVQIAAAGASNSPVEIAVTFTIAATPPALPGSPTATAVSDHRIDVAWTDQSNDESRFDVERSSNGVTGWTVIGSASADQTTYADSAGLAGSTAYYYRISACNAVGCTPNATVAAATTAPDTPTNVTTSASASTQVDLTWTDNSTDETGFPIERSSNGGVSWTVIATASAGTTSYSDATAEPVTTYRYRIRACRNTVCSRYSSESEVTTPTAPVPPPGTPSGLTASAASADRIDLAWIASSGTVSWYRIERKNNTLAGSYAVVDSVIGGTLAYQSTGLTPLTSYSHRVQACSSAGCSGYSNEATTSTPALVALPNTPADLAATANSATQIGLTWTHDGLAVGSFEIERAPSDEQSNFTPLTTVTGSARSYVDEELIGGTSYYYRARACNLTGCSAYSSVANAKTLAPDTPTSVTAVATSAAQVTVGWTPPGGQTYYQIRRRLNGIGKSTVITVNSASATTYEDSGLTSNTRYTYQVRACAAENSCSSYSTAVSVTTQ